MSSNFPLYKQLSIYVEYNGTFSQNVKTFAGDISTKKKKRQEVSHIIWFVKTGIQISRDFNGHECAVGNFSLQASSPLNIFLGLGKAAKIYII